MVINMMKLDVHPEQGLQRSGQLHHHGQRRQGGTATSTVSIGVNPVNDAPKFNDPTTLTTTR